MSAGRKSDRCAASRGGAAPNAVSFVNAAAGMNEEAAGNFGRIATEEEVQGDPADRGYVTCLALLNRIRRWWARGTGKDSRKTPIQVDGWYSMAYTSK